MRLAGLLGALAASFLLAGPASAAFIRCKLSYEVTGWSFLYKQYKGTGVVTCSDGSRANVNIVSRGGGITFGKTDISNGTGVFSDVREISEVYGTYVATDGHAGAVAAAEGVAMTKGPVSLALSGTGRGFSLGFSFSGFTIRPR
jgi:hypothetical protein